MTHCDFWARRSFRLAAHMPPAAGATTSKEPVASLQGSPSYSWALPSCTFIHSYPSGLGGAVRPAGQHVTKAPRSPASTSLLPTEGQATSADSAEIPRRLRPLLCRHVPRSTPVTLTLPCLGIYSRKHLQRRKKMYPQGRAPLLFKTNTPEKGCVGWGWGVDNPTCPKQRQLVES